MQIFKATSPHTAMVGNQMRSDVFTKGGSRTPAKTEGGDEMGSRGPVGNQELRFVKGTARKAEERRKPKARPTGAGVPIAPGWLGPEARAEWDRVVPGMERDGRLVPGVGATLAAYCAAVGRLEMAERVLADGAGLVSSVGPNGYRQQRPEVSIAQKAGAEVLKLASALGLTPAGDARLPKRPEEPQESVTDRLRREHLERKARRGDKLAASQLKLAKIQARKGRA
jgi:P27 family predicted phage terminase small subunit